MRQGGWFIILLTVCVTACTPEMGGVIIDADVNLVVWDKQNRNLLDSITPGYFKKEGIILYNLKDGVKEEVYHSNYDAPRNFLIFKNEGNNEPVMKMFPEVGSLGKNETKLVTTYIKWNDQDEDTVICTVNRVHHKEGEITNVSQVWYNGKLMYDIQVNGAPTTFGNGIFARLLEIKKTY